MASVGTDALKTNMYIGVGVGWQRRCKTCHSLRERDNQGTVFFFFTGHHDGYRVTVCRSYCAGWRTLTRTRGIIASRSVNMVRHPRGNYIVMPIAVSGVVTPEHKVTHWRCHP